MTPTPAVDELLVQSVTAYSARVRDAVLEQHPGSSVSSPLGVWLLLCACLSAAEGADLRDLEAIVGCSRAEAAELLDAFIANVPLAISSALAVWARDTALTDLLQAWLAQLPAGIERGSMPTQAAADAWTKQNTLELIETFPANVSEFELVLVSALATRVSWRDPYEVTAASDAFSASSPWAHSVERILHTRHAWLSAIVNTEAAGLVAVHQAVAQEDLVVICVSAGPARPRERVLAAAHEVCQLAQSDNTLPAHSLFDLPLGDGHSWTIGEREREARRAGQRYERISGVALPAWGIESELDLMASPAFGATTATRILQHLTADGPSDSRQVARATFDRHGFTAAAMTGMAFATGLSITNEVGIERTAELRFDHPFAAIAVCRESSGDAVRFRGLPVFEAWVDTPTEVPEDS